MILADIAHEHRARLDQRARSGAGADDLSPRFSAMIALAAAGSKSESRM
jgi:hypothetical protein